MLEGTQISHPDPDLRRLAVIGIQTYIDMVQTVRSGGKDQVRGSGSGKGDQDGATIDCFHDPAPWRRAGRNSIGADSAWKLIHQDGSPIPSDWRQSWPLIKKEGGQEPALIRLNRISLLEYHVSPKDLRRRSAMVDRTSG